MPPPCQRLREMVTLLAVAILALAGTGCVASFFLQDSACHGFTVEDPLLEIRTLRDSCDTCSHHLFPPVPFYDFESIYDPAAKHPCRHTQ